MKVNIFLFLIFNLSILSCNCPKSADIIFYKKENKLEITTKNAFIDSILIHEEFEIHYDFVDENKDDVKIYRIGKRMDNRLNLNNIDSNYLVKGNLKEILLKKAISFDVNLYIESNSENRYDSRLARFIVADTSKNIIIEKYGGGCK
jgi:hypothetical protein